MESRTEIVDLELDGRITPLEVKEKLNQTLPPGIEILEADEVPLNSTSSSVLIRSVYWIPLDHLISKEEATSRIQKALEKEEFILHQERKGKRRSVDVRPLIGKMEVKKGEESAGIAPTWGVELVLQIGVGRTAKPTEIMGAILGLKEEHLAQCRIIKLE
jgi:radical SAM-linked protein